MGNYDKIYTAKINRPIVSENFAASAKSLVFKLLPPSKPVVFIGLSVVVLSVLQILSIGILDRWGVSPKISLIGSSLFYAFVFASLAIVGGIKRKEKAKVVKKRLETQPICKMLIISREKGD